MRKDVNEIHEEFCGGGDLEEVVEAPALLSIN